MKKNLCTTILLLGISIVSTFGQTNQKENIIGLHFGPGLYYSSYFDANGKAVQFTYSNNVWKNYIRINPEFYIGLFSTNTSYNSAIIPTLNLELIPLHYKLIQLSAKGGAGLCFEKGITDNQSLEDDLYYSFENSKISNFVYIVHKLAVDFTVSIPNSIVSLNTECQITQGEIDNKNVGLLQFLLGIQISI